MKNKLEKTIIMKEELSSEWQKDIKDSLEANPQIIASARMANGQININSIYHTLCFELEIGFKPGEAYKMDLVFNLISKWVEDHVTIQRISTDRIRDNIPLLILENKTKGGKWVNLFGRRLESNIEGIKDYIADRVKESGPYYLDFEGFSLKILGRVLLIPEGIEEETLSVRNTPEDDLEIIK